MRNDQVETPAPFFEVDAAQVVEIPFVDQNGEDLGSFQVDRDQTVGQMIHEIVEESGLPTDNPDGSPKRYEGYQIGEKLRFHFLEQVTHTVAFQLKDPQAVCLAEKIVCFRVIHRDGVQLDLFSDVLLNEF